MRKVYFCSTIIIIIKLWLMNVMKFRLVFTINSQSLTFRLNFHFFWWFTIFLHNVQKKSATSKAKRGEPRKSKQTSFKEEMKKHKRQQKIRRPIWHSILLILLYTFLSFPYSSTTTKQDFYTHLLDSSIYTRNLLTHVLLRAFKRCFAYKRSNIK